MKKQLYKGFSIELNEKDGTCTTRHEKYIPKIFLNVETAKKGIDFLDIELIEPRIVYDGEFEAKNPNRSKPKKAKTPKMLLILYILTWTLIAIVVGLMAYALYTFGFWVCFLTFLFFALASTMTVSFGFWF